MLLLLDLFLLFFKIGAFSFGGGYAMIPIMQEEVIYRRNLLTEQQFIDVISVAQVAPGAIAVNSATLLGFQVYGFPGALVATVAVILPSVMIIILLAYCFIKLQENCHMENAFLIVRPAILGLIASAVYFLWDSALFDPVTAAIDPIKLVIALLAFGLIAIKNVHPILVLLAAGVSGALIYGF
jgi:chromate transporter